MSDRYIVLVGSSARLKNKGLGEQIDKFDLVARFNAAPTIGFEKDVGSRTTHRFIGTSAISSNEYFNKDTHPYSLKQLGGVALIGDLRPRLGQKYSPFLNDKFTVESARYVRAIKQITDLTGVRFGEVPRLSTGFKGIAYFLEDEPAICGYDFDIEKPKYLTHYWDDKNGGIAQHSWDTERRAIIKLLELGILEVIDE